MDSSKINSIIISSKFSPVIVIGEDFRLLGPSTVLSSNISETELTVYNEKSAKVPSWLVDIMNSKSSPQIVITDIDRISLTEQSKFYELLKFRAINGIKLPSQCRLILTASSLNNISEVIFRLCQIFE